MSSATTQRTREEFNARVEVTADRIAAALNGERNPIVVLAALMRIHRFICRHLPAKDVGEVSFSLAAYAGDLLQTSTKGKGLDSTPSTDRSQS